MKETVKALRLPNGYSVYIAQDDWCDVENPLEWEMGEVEFYLYGGRNHRDVFTGDKSTGTPMWEDWADKLDEVVDAFGKNARGSDVVNVMGFDWVVLYDLVFREYPPFKDVEPWQARLLKRGVNWVNANYHTCLISRYKHGSVLYTRGGPTCRWDSGICGFAVSPRDQRDAETFTARVDSALDTYTDWCNGEVYQVVVEDASGAVVDAVSGYIGMLHAEDGFEEMKAEWADKQDTSLLEILTIEGRAYTLDRVIGLMEMIRDGASQQALKDLHINMCFTEHLGEERSLLADVDHQRVVRLYRGDKEGLSPEAVTFVTQYYQVYMKSALENL